MRRYKSSDLAAIEQLSTREAMVKLNMSHEQLRSVRKYYGIPSNDKQARPAKYSAEDVARMMELRSTGFSYESVGKEFCVSASSIIYAIKRAEQTGFDVYKKRGK